MSTTIEKKYNKTEVDTLLNAVDITSNISYNETVGTWTKVTVKAGVVYINFQGEAKARSANDILMTIPAGYHPKNVVACPFTYANQNVYGTVSINTNGQVVVRSINDSTTSGRLIFNLSYTL